MERNELYPIFLKLHNLNVLIVGGGNVGLEKLSFLLKSSPNANVEVVATHFLPELETLVENHSSVKLIKAKFKKKMLKKRHMVIACTDDLKVNKRVYDLSRKRHLICNIADTPDLCDYYLGGIVTKGNVKIAISTNGKSPTIAKRLKEQINDLVPDEIEEVLDNMHIIRNGLDGDFADKVKNLNEITSVLAAKQIVLNGTQKPGTKKWQKIVKWCLFAFCFMILGHAILSYIPFHEIMGRIKTIPDYVELKLFLIMFCTGFIAQMVDGSLGMGYGTISTTFLLANGVSPAIVSSRVHSARVFSSGVSGYSHHRFGNINKKLFKALVIPGILGAIMGATLAYFSQKYVSYVRVPLSIYTLYLGYFILQKAFKKKQLPGKIKKAGWLATLGGFMDSYAGGGWGTLVTSTLISKRKNARYVIGSVCLAEFFVVLASSITFFIVLKSLPLLDIAGLIVGGLLAAPLAARMVGKVPMKKMFIAIGALVIITSCMTLWKVIAQLMAG